MKKLVALAVLAASVSMASAGATYYYPQGDGGLITTDVATGVSRPYWQHRDMNGNMVLCTDNDFHWRDWACDGGWKVPERLVPPGRKYVGFRSISEGSRRMVEIYWK